MRRSREIGWGNAEILLYELTKGGTCCTSSGTKLQMQQFTATQGQTNFTVTDFTLTTAIQVYVNGAFQDGNYTVVGNTVSFIGGLTSGDIVKIWD